MKIIRNLVLSSFGIFIIFMICKGFSFWDETSNLQRQPISHYGEAMQMTENRNLLHGFILNKLNSKYGSEQSSPLIRHLASAIGTVQNSINSIR